MRATAEAMMVCGESGKHSERKNRRAHRLEDLMTKVLSAVGLEPRFTRVP